jgi:N12 class adenine-specific DNA methylase
MDKTATHARQHIAEMADLAGAVRLPQAAMLADAGTDVVVDVLIFRKRLVGEESRAPCWMGVRDVPDSDEGEGPLSVNGYFLDQPEMVLGTHAWTTSPYGPAYTCRGIDGQDLPDRLARVLAIATSGTRFPLPEAVTAERTRAPRIVPGTVADGATLREGSYLLFGDVLHQVLDGAPRPVPIKSRSSKEGLFDKHARIIRALVPIRDAVRQVLRAQEANEPWGAHQTRLRIAYHQFTRQFGPINRVLTTTREVDVNAGRRRRLEAKLAGQPEPESADELEIDAVQAADAADHAEAGDAELDTAALLASLAPEMQERETQRRPNLQPFLDDPDVWLVSSIEEYDEETDTGRPGPVFSERVIHPPVEPLITSAQDALAVTLHETGMVDLARIAELLGRSRQHVLAELGEAVFLDPELTTEQHEAWVTADAALSGAVRTKLARAEAAAALDARYARNVIALREVQPEDLRPSDITARLGTPWMPSEYIEQFTAEVIGVASRVMHCAEVACWTVSKHVFAGQAASTSEWGTARRHAGELMDDALNSVMPQIWDVSRDAAGEHRVLNASETEAAKEKLAKIKRAFTSWVWTDSARSERLVRIYNDSFNNLIPRRFDGSHLQLPGASSAVTLRAHQKRAVWRIIASGSVVAWTLGWRCRSG